MHRTIAKWGSRIFLSYASEDFKSVNDLYDRLYGDGLHPWLDRRDLLPGKKWAQEIPLVLRDCRAVLVCLSHNSVKSVNKKRFLKTEIREVLSIAEAKPKGADFIIPVRLVNIDVTKIPKLRDIRHWNAADLFMPDGYDRLRAVLKDLPDASNISAHKPKPLTHRGIPVLHEPRQTRDAGAEREEDGFVAQSRSLAQMAVDAAHAGNKSRAMELLTEATMALDSEPHQERYFSHCLHFYYQGIKELVARERLRVVLGLIQPDPNWEGSRLRRWKDLTFSLAQLDQLAKYSFHGLTGMRMAILLLRTGFSTSDPIVSSSLKWIENELVQEDNESVDLQCSLCTGAAVSCLILAGQGQMVEGPLQWLHKQNKHFYVHRDHRVSGVPRGNHSMHYAAAVLEAFNDRYGSTSAKTLDVLSKMLTRRRSTQSLLESWTKYRDVPIADVLSAMFPSLLRFRCAGASFTPFQHRKLSEIVKQLNAHLREETRGLPRRAEYYPVRDNISGLVLARDLTGHSDLLDDVLKYLRKRADSPLFAEKLWRRLLDSKGDRTALHIYGWLSYHELELSRVSRSKGHTSLT